MNDYTIDFNIDKKRFDLKFKAQLVSLETTVFDIPDACRNCAYRNRDLNYCWYKMVTNRKSNCTMTKCDHYVDIRKVKP